MIPRRGRIGAAIFAITTVVIGCAGADADHVVRPLDPPLDPSSEALEPLARAIGNRRVVLIGENGHGVGELTSLKANLVEWLHRDLGFDVAAFESGFFECGRVWRRLESLTARDAALECLRYPFQHAEVVPLFEAARASLASPRPLEIAGVDPQAQGYDSGPRADELVRWLGPGETELAARIAAVDTALYLPGDRGGMGDEVYPWLLDNASNARAMYDSAAVPLEGWEEWVLRLSTAWIDRLETRAIAEAAGEPRPASYYEIRDEWMARAVTALADSISGSRKVVVWLHNDHARYGAFRVGDHSIRSVGGFLREWMPDDVYSIGLFMGRGAIADNGRTVHDVGAPDPGGVEAVLGAPGFPAAYLVLRGHARDSLGAWAASPRAYLRMGLESRELTPAREFDALVYVDSVGPPTYRMPR